MYTFIDTACEQVDIHVCACVCKDSGSQHGLDLLSVSLDYWHMLSRLPIYIGAGNPNSDPYSCTASTLLAEACPRTLCMQFDEWKIGNLITWGIWVMILSGKNSFTVRIILATN